MKRLRKAKQCSVSRHTINAIENSKYNPTLKLAFQIAFVLNTRVDALFFTVVINNKLVNHLRYICMGLLREYPSTLAKLIFHFFRKCCFRLRCPIQTYVCFN